MSTPTFTFECPECQSTTEYSSESEDVNTSSTIVCASCQTLYDIDEDRNTTRSKFNKTNYQNKIKGITNQLAISSSQQRNTYTVPCPHCNHSWEMKGIPIKSVHQCKCSGYFGIDDVKVTILSNANAKEKQFKHGFQVSPIYSDSIFERDIDKLADLWSNLNPKSVVGRI